MFGFGQLIDILKKSPKKIVFTEGEDPRILEAASRLLAGTFLHPILIGNSDKIYAVAEESGFNIRGAEIIDPSNYDRFDEMVEIFCELRKKKGVTPELARGVLSQANYFGTMLVKMGVADALLGGATYSTADTVRPALQLVKAAPGNKLVSSCFILIKEESQLIMGDCSININPNTDDLVEITMQTAKSARQFGVEPKVALLSYSTMGSAKGECVAKMTEASDRLRRIADFDIDGEMQFDCAVSEEVAKLKAPESKVAGHANTFIFPNLSSGNIGYKIAARLGGYEAVGPILQGLNAPINDLSRGCTSDEIYKMAIVTAAQKDMDI